MSMMPLTFLEVLGDRAFVSTNAANADRAKKDFVERQKYDMQAYREGEAVAYTEARRLADKELRRLCNLFQNGALEISDFGIHL